MTIRALDGEIESRRDALFALCADLVAVDSSSPPGRTAQIADVVTAWLGQEGVTVERIAAAPEAPNLLARVAGARPGRHVVFNAHMDTMETGDPSAWSVPPFALTRRDGRAYGHGIGNMKGALAAMCLVTALVARRRGETAGILSLTAVSDEVMFGERGAPYLLATRPDVRGDMLISGEGPGFMALAIAEKGLLWLDVEARGAGGHSSGAEAGKTATMALSRFLAAVDCLNESHAVPPPQLTGVSGGEGEVGWRLSANAATLAAGTFRSQIATTAAAQLDLRLPPGIGADEAERRVRACVPAGADIVIRRVKGWDANWTAAASPLARAVSAAAAAVRGATPPAVVRLPGSDARRWRDLGVPAVCYGPQPTLSAGIDDYAGEQDLVDCAKVYARAALALMAG